LTINLGSKNGTHIIINLDPFFHNHRFYLNGFSVVTILHEKFFDASKSDVYYYLPSALFKITLKTVYIFSK